MSASLMRGNSKTLLKLTIPRVKLLRNRRELQLRQMRRDIAKLLEAGQEATARIRVACLWEIRLDWSRVRFSPSAPG
jgi:hypothetical protein